MPKFSKKTLQKLHIHLSKLKKTIHDYEEKTEDVKGQGFPRSRKLFRHSQIVVKNKDLIKNLLIELIFFRIQLQEINEKKISLDKQIILENKNFFINKRLYDKTFLSYNNEYFITKKAKTLIKIISKDIKKLKLLIREYLFFAEDKITELYENHKNIKLLKNYFFILIKKIELYLVFITNLITKRWIVYLTRFLIMTLIHFVPFIQLTSALFYNLPNPNIAHPISSTIFNVTPLLVPLIRLTAPIVNQENFSFLILIPYMHLFAFSFKKYKIPRKIAYQGTFALSLQLFRYSIFLCQDTTRVVYKYTKKFFRIRKFQALNLLFEDAEFYLDDLDDIRVYREYFLQLGESSTSLEVLAPVAKLYEPTIILAFLGVIALLYNYMYFIFRGQKPIIPGVTKLVRRMMVDRNSEES